MIESLLMMAHQPIISVLTSIGPKLLGLRHGMEQLISSPVDDAVRA
ncbi:hypothetical protein [Mesorhizobium sp. ES1-4]|nr:hypothetical protein [Mesorhizobium sp. ES1-4]MBZ9799466.1 hypothetical protein [Mesorhizobium sp. ES1-4]